MPTPGRTPHTAVFGIYKSTALAERTVGHLRAAGCSRAAISALLFDSRAGSDAPLQLKTGPLGALPGFGPLSVPGLGPVIGGGPIIALLSSVAPAAAGGGLRAALGALGLPPHVASRYVGLLSTDAALVALHCANSELVSHARAVLRLTGAAEVTASADGPCAELRASRVA